MNEDKFDELMYDFYLFTQILAVLGVSTEKVFSEDILWDSYRKDDICFNTAKYMYEQIKANYVVADTEIHGQQSLFDNQN